MPFKYPPLPQHLRAQLEAVPPSTHDGLEYRPCRVTLSDGRVMDRVYVVPAKQYLHVWGVTPESDSGKRSVSIRDVVAIEESPDRLPARFANEMYAAGESGMGYCLFELEFADASTQAYLTGNAVDFIPYPPGKSGADIVALHPHHGRDQHYLNGDDYWWCLYSPSILEWIGAWLALLRN
jgi:hypothetical protein